MDSKTFVNKAFINPQGWRGVWAVEFPIYRYVKNLGTNKLILRATQWVSDGPPHRVHNRGTRHLTCSPKMTP